MATLHHNITGEITKELLAVGDKASISKISLTNIEGTYPCTVDLYISKKHKGICNQCQCPFWFFLKFINT